MYHPCLIHGLFIFYNEGFFFGNKSNVLLFSADSTSVATEYSLKFDESMTEDEIEEKSFRSLLPSESHRRINLKKRDHQDYSDEEATPAKTTLPPVKVGFNTPWPCMFGVFKLA